MCPKGLLLCSCAHGGEAGHLLLCYGSCSSRYNSWAVGGATQCSFMKGWGKCFLRSWNKLLFYLLSIRDIKLSFDGRKKREKKKRKKRERKNLPALVGDAVVSVTPAKGRWVQIKRHVWKIGRTSSYNLWCFSSQNYERASHWDVQLA